MASNQRDRTLPAPSEATLDAWSPSDDQGLSGGASSRPGAALPVRLVEGKAPGLTQETANLLRARLRLASLFFTIGFAIFLVKSLFQLEFGSPINVYVFSLHAFVTLVAGGLTAVLCHRCEVPLRYLRLAELTIFGLPLLFFALVQHLAILDCCEQGYLRLVAGPWLLLIYTYALFIPNPLGRAAVVLSIFAAAPILVVGGTLWAHPEVARLASFEDVSAFMLVMILAAGSSVFGVDTIGTLRRQAFEAKQLGHYRLKRRIGAGGMGEVYLAEHQMMKRPCVIKLIRPEKTQDPRVLKRFQREVRATAKLSHWNTVEIFDYGHTDENTFYYVMEYLPGMSLAELVERFGPMPPERVIHFLRQACDALCEAHAAGLVHRDIKPANVFAAMRGGVYDVAKLLDFGLVKPLAEEQPLELTTEGAITGSPLFMSPEQALGDMPPDARSDIYSLGAVGYYLLTGKPPFEGDRTIKVLIAHAHEEAVPPSERRPGLPHDLEAVILRCLQKKPEDRFQRASEMEAALAACDDAGRWTRRIAADWWQRQEEALEV
jgi:serine/threonine-protein kinase